MTYGSAGLSGALRAAGAGFGPDLAAVAVLWRFSSCGLCGGGGGCGGVFPPPCGPCDGGLFLGSACPELPLPRLPDESPGGGPPPPPGGGGGVVIDC